ncbi:hypothetical protein TNIN_17381 [Trichonephila inaurata madagascariensis]|uniref:Uncharacterized protein n=1 Tax=Trichonephila inaurata madagascariensis TaxID=2747483 RepID=A0A8X6MIR9_9ARAC|nr:hypothetical protein TNIN_17381 [Trichonephila inaurata madagascariensis]
MLPVLESVDLVRKVYITLSLTHAVAVYGWKKQTVKNLRFRKRIFSNDIERNKKLPSMKKEQIRKIPRFRKRMFGNGNERDKNLPFNSMGCLMKPYQKHLILYSPGCGTRWSK